MSAARFATHFTRELFDELARFVCTDIEPNSGQAWDAYKAEMHALDERAARAIEAFLQQKRISGLPKARFVDGRQFAFADRWNQFVIEGEFEHPFERTQFLDAMTQAFVMSNIGLSIDIRAEGADHDVLYQRFVAAMDRGDFPWFMTKQRSPCYVTGQQLALYFQGWEPIVGVLNLKDPNNRVSPLTSEAPAPTVSHHVIPVPSGELIVCDFVEIPAFRQAVRDPAYITGYSLETSVGCLRAASWYAQLGFMAVTVGNTSPSVIMKDGLLAFASVEAKHKINGEVVAEICTERWWATAIDREVLTDIIAKTVSRDEAERQVAAYIDEMDLPVLRVRKGQLHLYHTADHEAMNGMTCAEVKTSGFSDLFAVLSERELTWAPKRQSVASDLVEASKAPKP